MLISVLDVLSFFCLILFYLISIDFPVVIDDAVDIDDDAMGFFLQNHFRQISLKLINDH